MIYRNTIILFTVIFATAAYPETISFQHAGKARNCVVHVPAGISKPAVVFFLHGAGGSGAGFENDTKADVVADREKFIAAYPSGVNGNWNYNDGSDDFTFMKALIDTIDSRYHIDRNRLYVTGFSMGGGMTFALACKYSDIFAAAAPVSAAGTACTPKRKIPLLLTFGTKDMYPPANYMTAINRWLGIDGCPNTPVVTRPYPSSNAQSKVTRLTYEPCGEGTVVIADSIQGGPHEWPMDTRTKVNNSEEVWAFFKKFLLDKTPVVQKTSNIKSNENITTLYSAGTIYLQGLSEYSQTRVIDTKGRVITCAKGTQPRITFANKSSGVYIVLVSGMDRSFQNTIVLP